MFTVRRIWDSAPHNAFTDLLWHEGLWYCVFREGAGHVSPDGALRVITSPDGENWTSAALLTSDEGDLRDAKIGVTPAGELMLGGGILTGETQAEWVFRSLVWFSRDGRQWSEPQQVGATHDWLWRFTWQEGVCYSFGYGCGQGGRHIQLYRSLDGRSFTPLGGPQFTDCYPNETQIVFDPAGMAYCLLRRDPDNGLIGTATPPYEQWQWRDLGLRIGGPALIRLPDGRFVGCVRRYYEPEYRTALGWITPQAGSYEEFLELPSGGDTSYAGLVWREEQLWVSYYSSHEEKTSIYLAQVNLPPAT